MSCDNNKIDKCVTKSGQGLMQIRLILKTALWLMKIAKINTSQSQNAKLVLAIDNLKVFLSFGTNPILWKDQTSYFMKTSSTLWSFYLLGGLGKRTIKQGMLTSLVHEKNHQPI